MRSFRHVGMLAIWLLAACSSTSESEIAVSAMKLTSAAFSEGGTIADKYAYNLGGQCNGENYSPPLAWTGAPAGTQSFAILVLDPDGRNWVHWLQFNIPAHAASLAEAIGGTNVGIKGLNDFGGLGYGGPCPPRGTHRYVFTLYALDATLSLEEGASRTNFDSAIKGHVLGTAQLTGLRSR